MPYERKRLSMACENCGAVFFLPPSTAVRGTKCCSLACRDAVRRRSVYDDEGSRKRCAGCGEWKPFAAFAPTSGEKASTKAVALQSHCRPCGLEKSAQWAKENAAAKRRHKAVSYLMHQEKLRAGKRVENMTDEARAKKLASAKRSRKKRADAIRLLNRLRRVRERAAGKLPDRHEIGRMLCSQDARCTYCHCLLSSFHIDHIMPVSRGGLNDRANLQLLCPTCNMKKGASTHAEYALRVGPVAASELDLLADTIQALNP